MRGVVEGLFVCNARVNLSALAFHGSYRLVFHKNQRLESSKVNQSARRRYGRTIAISDNVTSRYRGKPSCLARLGFSSREELFEVGQEF